MAVGDALVCLLVSHTITNTTFFPKPPTTFLTGFSKGDRQKYPEKKVRLKRVSNSQPPRHESDTLNTELHGPHFHLFNEVEFVPCKDCFTIKGSKMLWMALG